MKSKAQALVDSLLEADWHSDSERTALQQGPATQRTVPYVDPKTRKQRMVPWVSRRPAPATRPKAYSSMMVP